MSLVSVKITDLDLLFVKEYLKIDYAEDDKLISSIILAAQSYIQTILGYKFSEFDEIPDELTIACLLIIAHWYENRQFQTTGTLGDEIKFSVSAIVDAHRSHVK